MVLLLESEEELDAAVERRVGLDAALGLVLGDLTVPGAFADGARHARHVDRERETEPETEVARDVHRGADLRTEDEGVLRPLPHELHVLELPRGVANRPVEGVRVAVGLEPGERTDVEAPEVTLGARILELHAGRPPEGERAGVAVLAALSHDGLQGEVDGDHGARERELSADGEASSRAAVDDERAHTEDETMADGRGRLQVGNEPVVHVQTDRLLGLRQRIDARLERAPAVRRVPATRRGGGLGRDDGGERFDGDRHGVVVGRTGGRDVAERGRGVGGEGRGGNPDAARVRPVRRAGDLVAADPGLGPLGGPARGGGEAALLIDDDTHARLLALLDLPLVGVDPGGRLGERGVGDEERGDERDCGNEVLVVHGDGHSFRE